jgi:hypothetical protein
MANKQYIIIKSIANIVSGISMVTLIALGVMYMSFNNAFVFQDIKIEITNNPVTHASDIEFMMVGSKKHECNSTRVYGVAYSNEGHSYRLDKFTKQYTRNTHPGNEIPNQWAMQIPDEIKSGGEFRVSMTGEFVCNYFIFQKEKSQTFDNILLVIE